MLVLFIICHSCSQEQHKNYFAQWTTWTLIQTIPSPVFFQDNNNSNSRLQFGLRWHVTPINYSFNTNKFISPLSFFIVNPLNRYGGSIETIIQPEWTTAAYKYSDMNRFQIGTGIRGFIPLIEEGEDLSMSFGGKYRIRQDLSGTNLNTFSIEMGIYTFYGVIGIQFNYNFNTTSRFDIGISLKYF